MKKILTVLFFSSLGVSFAMDKKNDLNQDKITHLMGAIENCNQWIGKAQKNNGFGPKQECWERDAPYRYTQYYERPVAYIEKERGNFEKELDGYLKPDNDLPKGTKLINDFLKNSDSTKEKIDLSNKSLAFPGFSYGEEVNKTIQCSTDNFLALLSQKYQLPSGVLEKISTQLSWDIQDAFRKAELTSAQASHSEEGEKFSDKNINSFFTLSIRRRYEEKGWEGFTNDERELAECLSQAAQQLDYESFLQMGKQIPQTVKKLGIRKALQSFFEICNQPAPQNLIERLGADEKSLASLFDLSMLHELKIREKKQKCEKQNDFNKLKNALTGEGSLNFIKFITEESSKEKNKNKSYAEWVYWNLLLDLDKLNFDISRESLSSFIHVLGTAPKESLRTNYDLLDLLEKKCSIK